MTNQHFINLSRIYEQNEKVKISLQGKKLDKMKSQALENPEQFWGEQAKSLIWFKQVGQSIRLEPRSILQMVRWW